MNTLMQLLFLMTYFTLSPIRTRICVLKLCIEYLIMTGFELWSTRKCDGYLGDCFEDWEHSSAKGSDHSHEEKVRDGEQQVSDVRLYKENQKGLEIIPKHEECSEKKEFIVESIQSEQVQCISQEETISYLPNPENSQERFSRYRGDKQNGATICEGDTRWKDMRQRESALLSRKKIVRNVAEGPWEVRQPRRTPRPREEEEEGKAWIIPWEGWGIKNVDKEDLYVLAGLGAAMTSNPTDFYLYKNLIYHNFNYLL